MSTKSKFNNKVKAVKKFGDIPDKEARAIAKCSKIVRVKKKRLILRGPKRQIIGGLHRHDDGTLHIRFPLGVKFEQDGENGLLVTMPDGEPEKKAKAKPKKKKGVDGKAGAK